MYELMPVHFLLLPLVGLVVASLGTLVGLGGGFVLIPVLLVIFPEASASTISSISLTVVFLNAASASIANLRQRRIDVRTAALLSMGAIPAATAGALFIRLVRREYFETLFGWILIAGALYVLWRGLIVPLRGISEHAPNREIRERRGPVYRFYVSTLMAGVISPIGGFISSFFGIGGGVVHVPAMTFILKMPPRVVGATALFVLVPTSIAGVITRIVTDQFDEGWRRVGLLGLGALIGAQVGLYLSRRVNQRVVLAFLSAAMVIVGVRQIVAGL